MRGAGSHGVARRARLTMRGAAHASRVAAGAELAGFLRHAPHIEWRLVEPARYFETLATYRFLLAPRGNSVTSPKFVEALMLQVCVRVCVRVCACVCVRVCVCACVCLHFVRSSATLSPQPGSSRSPALHRASSPTSCLLTRAFRRSPSPSGTPPSRTCSALACRSSSSTLGRRSRRKASSGGGASSHRACATRAGWARCAARCRSTARWEARATGHPRACTDASDTTHRRCSTRRRERAGSHGERARSLAASSVVGICTDNLTSRGSYGD